ncbi:phosphonate ABC transporter, permease protein PhnE [Dysosmobacter sp.]|uniref:phosphonate ABC transporter, permease protein PhnE n=1 Tax=Dysosmobacter sp. TaxID=2591382 RepID=UPI002A86439F|nr:phosphonate ABC transporter, permease protein PhnE [Dysosmobacter sp.]MDY3983950.1 phosphonate ABC transporter, permease protein PhnE [Dysosmobacter sp.]
MNLYDRIFKPRKLELPNGKVVEERFTRLPLILLIVLICTAVSVHITGFNFSILAANGKKFFDILWQMFPPNTEYLPKIWGPLWDTIKMSILGSFIGAVLAVPFAILAASNIVTNRVVVFIVRLFLSLVRTLPTLVCALIATYIFGLGTMAGTCAIAVFTFAYVGKQLFELIETVDMGPFEAMEALGATRMQAFVTAVFPQVLPTYLSVSLFCLEGNVRYASILGYVGAGGLGLIMNEKIGWREYSSVGMILIVLFVTVIVIEGLSHAARKRLT